MEDNRTYTKGCDCKHLVGIKCDVENCYYNEKSSYCTAKEIAVGCHGAACCQETLCTTFKPKAE